MNDSPQPPRRKSDPWLSAADLLFWFGLAALSVKAAFTCL
jgi:hypothetical protein